MNARRPNPRRHTVWTGFLAASMVACLGPTEPVEILQWQAPLAAAPDAATPITGSIAMVARELETRIGVGIRDAEPGARLGWHVRSGRCSGSGDAVAPTSVFPVIVVLDDGQGRAEAVVRRRLSGNAYAGEVFADPDGSRIVLACADLDRGA